MAGIALGSYSNVSAWNVGNDVLEVRAQDAQGNRVIARGWVSHIHNFYPPASYDAQGNLLPSAVARQMTAAELRAYAQSLLDQASGLGAGATQVL